MKQKVDYTPKAKKDPILDRKFSTKKVKVDPSFRFPVVSECAPRETKKFNSRVTPGHDTAPKVIPECTLPNLIGISVVHKSNLQPVFSTEQAKDFASMRR
jgi:uncharacterized protein YlaI